MLDFYHGEILLIDKPFTWSSFQAVNKIKHLIKNHPSLLVENKKVKPKVGHAGTLDPLATGLLIICTGKKTKILNSFMNDEKEYTGTFFLGATTPCFDLEQPIDKKFPFQHITEEKIKSVAKLFLGKQLQVPPAHSAVMVSGERAYKLARDGKEVELKPKEIEIKAFEITRIEMPEVDFRIVCSKGTYIRSIARDLGIALESGAHLTKLCRTRIGKYKLTDAQSLKVFEESLREEL